VRLTRHPILEFDRGREIEFEFDGRKLLGFEGESIAAALHANGVRVLRESIKKKRPRGFFCAIGRCSSCLMTVDGIPNIMTCVTPLKKGMRVETQRGKGSVPLAEPSSAGPPPSETKRGTDEVATIPLAIVGAGPAGLSAAAYAGRMGVETVVIDENDVPGGQLIKQTHMFFGSREHYAQIRGIDIGDKLIANLSDLPAKLMLGTTVLGLYPDRTLSLLTAGRHVRLRAGAVILATGASENMLAFENCDLPGVYGAGAVQTLMNVYGVVPGKRVLMVGAGNIGLIVAYQLLQAGVDVAAVIDAAPEVGGYHVHAAKIRRAGVPILISHTVLRVTGPDRVESAEICRVDDHWQPVPGSETTLSVDTVCLAVGLTPNCELAFQMGCRQTYMPELGGLVAVHGSHLETSIPGVFIAGDASGVEEASTAMIEGRLAGLAAAEWLGTEFDADELTRLRAEAAGSLETLRAGPFGAKAREGKKKMLSSMNEDKADSK
jgi:sarcosine oxidase subunit alpha